MSHPAGSDPEFDAADEDRRSVDAARATPRLGLALSDLVAAAAIAATLPDDQLSPLLDNLKDLASALATADRSAADAARLRLLAREVAVGKIHYDMLVAQVAERLRARDYNGARHVDALANSAAKRLAALLAEHRLTCSSPRQGIVAIASAGVVKIDGAR